MTTSIDMPLSRSHPRIGAHKLLNFDGDQIYTLCIRDGTPAYAEVTLYLSEEQARNIGNVISQVLGDVERGGPAYKWMPLTAE